MAAATRIGEGSVRSDSLADVSHVMGEHDIAHLVVVDDCSEPIGVISTLDVACALAGRAV